MTEESVSATPRVRTDTAVLSRAVDDELVLYHPTTDAITHLDPIAAHVWRQLATEPTIDELLTALTDHFDADPDRLRRDTVQLMGELAEAQLISIG